MSAFIALTRVSEIYSTCLGFDENDFITEILAVADFWPAFLAAASLGLSFYHMEAFFWFITTAIFADWFINYGLQAAWGPSNNIQPESCLYTDYQMPAFCSQLVTMLWTLGFGMIVLLYPRGITRYESAFLIVLAEIGVYARIYLIFSTPTQLIVGSFIGFLEGLAFLGVVLLLRYFGIDKTIISSPGNLFCPPVSDTILYPEEPTICLTQKPKKVVIKVDYNQIFLEDL